MEWSYGRAGELEDDLEFLSDTLRQAGADAIAVAEWRRSSGSRRYMRFHGAALDIAAETAPSTAFAIGQLLTIAAWMGPTTSIGRNTGNEN